MPKDYHRRQTLKNVERYITPELKAFEDKALSANERALAREKFLYDQLLDQLAPFIPQLQSIAAAIAELDVLATFAERAASLNFNAPQFSDDAQISIKQGRHPVVEAQVETFIPNDTTLNDTRRTLLITGPNMGGKSPICGRSPSSRCWRMSAASSPRRKLCWVRSTRYSRASAHRTT